jgi:hypothetical protein
MIETVQDIRNKVQDLLDRAQLDAGLRQMLQVNADGTLSAAGLSNAVFSSEAPVEECADTCAATCWITVWLPPSYPPY